MNIKKLGIPLSIFLAALLNNLSYTQVITLNVEDNQYVYSISLITTIVQKDTNSIVSITNPTRTFLANTHTDTIKKYDCNYFVDVNTISGERVLINKKYIESITDKTSYVVLVLAENKRNFILSTSFSSIISQMSIEADCEESAIDSTYVSMYKDSVFIVSGGNSYFTGLNKEVVLDSIEELIAKKDNYFEGDKVFISNSGASYTIYSTNILNYPVDSLFVINLGGKYAILDTYESINIAHIEMQAGRYRDSTSVPFYIAENIRNDNFNRFKKAVSFATTFGKKILIPPLPYELKLKDGGKINIPDYSNLVIIGHSVSSELFITPIVNNYDESFFELGKGANLYIENLTILSTDAEIETYDVTLKPSGNSDTILINSTNIRSDFASDVVGKYIYVSYDYDMEADTVKVVSYNPATKILKLSRNINLPAATNDDHGFIGLEWKDSIDYDTLNAYSRFWNFQNRGFTFVNFLHGEDETYAYWNIKNVVSYGFFVFISRSHGAIFANVIQCDLAATAGIISWYSSSTKPIRSKLNVLNCNLHDSGRLSHGQNPGNPEANGNDYYSIGALYAHPNQPVSFIGCNIYNCADAIRQYSEAGYTSKPKFDNDVSVFKDCKFWDNTGQYSLRVSSYIQTIVESCTFDDAIIVSNGYDYNNTRFISCYFDSCSINASANYVNCDITLIGLDSYHKYIFEDCKIKAITSSYLEIEPPQMMYFYDCEITSSNTSYAFFQEGPGNTKMYNCIWDSYIKYSWRNSNYNDSIEIVGCTFKKPFLVGTTQYVLPIDGKFSENRFLSTSGFTDDIEFNRNHKPEKSYVVSGTLKVNLEYNDYDVSGDPTNIKVYTYLDSNVLNNYGAHGYVYFRFDGDYTLEKFDKSSNSQSNFRDDIYTISGEKIVLRYDPFIFFVDTAINETDTLWYGNGSTTVFSYYGGMSHGSKINPGSLVVKAGTIKLYDDGRGKLYSQNGYGAVNYLTNYIYIIFNTPPPSGTPIEVQYTYYNTAYNYGGWEPVYSASSIKGFGTKNWHAMWTSPTTLGNASLYEEVNHVRCYTQYAPTILNNNTTQWVGDAPLHLINTSTGNNTWISMYFAETVGANVYGSIDVKKIDTSNKKGDMYFSTGSGSGLSNRMVLKNDGKVGIGTTSPSTKLHISGDTKSDGVITSSGSGSTAFSTTTAAEMRLNNTVGGTWSNIAIDNGNYRMYSPNNVKVFDISKNGSVLMTVDDDTISGFKVNGSDGNTYIQLVTTNGAENLRLGYPISTSWTTINAGLQVKVEGKNSNFNVYAGDYMLEVNASSGAITATLPVSPNTGETHIIVKNDSSVNAVTINGNGKTINGSSTYSLLSQYSKVTIVFTGTEWRIL